MAGQASAETQVTGLVGSASITLILLLAPGLLRNLPQPTLAAVLIAASISLADIPAVVRLYSVRRTEFSLSVAAFVGVVVLGVPPGIALAVALSIANPSAGRGGPTRPSSAAFPGNPRYRDIRSYPEAARLDGCLIFRFEAPVFFANTRTFREQVRGLSRTDPHHRWIIVAAEPVTDVDTTAADMLHDLDVALNDDGVNLVFAEMKETRPCKVDRYELTRTIDSSHCIPPLDAAVTALREQTGAGWSAPAPECTT